MTRGGLIKCQTDMEMDQEEGRGDQKEERKDVSKGIADNQKLIGEPIEMKAIFWMHRVLEEKCQDIKKISERISTLNHQITNFDSMDDASKEKVYDDLARDLSGYNWIAARNEIRYEQEEK